MNWLKSLLTALGLRRKPKRLSDPPKPEFELYTYEGDKLASGFVEEYIKDESEQTTGIVVSGDDAFTRKVSHIEGDVIVRVFVPAHASTQRVEQVKHFQAHAKGRASLARRGMAIVQIGPPHGPDEVEEDEEDVKGTLM